MIAGLVLVGGLGVAASGERPSDPTRAAAQSQPEAANPTVSEPTQTGRAAGPPCKVDTSVDRSTSQQPSDALTAVLGVLRTEPRPQDRFPAPARIRGTPGVQLEATRYLGAAPSGDRYYVVPLRNGHVAEAPLPRQCVQELSGEARKRAERRNRRIGHAKPAWDICLLSETGSGGCGMGGAAALRKRGTIGSSQGPAGGSDVVGLVPDGVASVTARYPDGFERTVPVASNFFSYRVSLGASRALQAQFLWKDQAGNVIRDIPPS